jgi:ABC-type transporter Mla subunit MlaD
MRRPAVASAAPAGETAAAAAARLGSAHAALVATLAAARAQKEADSSALRRAAEAAQRAARAGDTLRDSLAAECDALAAVMSSSTLNFLCLLFNTGPCRSADVLEMDEAGVEGREDAGAQSCLGADLSLTGAPPAAALELPFDGVRRRPAAVVAAL